ncbi:MAG: efflux RND transporter periplasmic adaptor subunit [Proteobacteria bacterium]|nr:efflux RND transporter periplasmic adaptor subunit [Pseudomonadota bacterium]
MSKSKKLLNFIVCLSVVVLGYFFWPKGNQSSQNQPTKEAVDVTVIPVTKQIVQLSVELPGRVNAQKISQIRPQVDGIIKEIKFTEGTFVEKGKQLYQIDPTIYQTALGAATSKVKTLKSKKERYQILVDVDAVSKQEFSDVEAELAQAQSEVSKAKKNLDYTKVLAPISGFVGKTNVTEGALVTANQTTILTTLAQIDPIYVDLEQPSKDVLAGSLKKEIAVNLLTEDPTYQNVGQLKFHEMFVDETTDSVRLRAVFNNEDHKLLPGMFVTAQLALPSFESIIVPQRVTSRAPDGSLLVWIVNADNSVSQRPIKASKTFKDLWVVEEGLAEGEIIVYEGFQKIRDGAKVNATPLQNTEEKK